MKTVFIPKVVADLISLYHPVISNKSDYPSISSQLTAMAELAYREYVDGGSRFCVEFQNHHPQFVGKDQEQICNSELELADFRYCLARSVGYESWRQIEDSGEVYYDLVFEDAVDSMLAGDIEILNSMMANSPHLVSARSSYPHRAALIHYAGSNGIEIWRQKVPSNLPEIVEMLLKKGVNKSELAILYGGKFDVLAMIESSSHPWEAGVGKELVELLTST